MKFLPWIRPVPLTREPAPVGQVRTARRGGRIRVVETWFNDDPPSLDGVDVWIAHQRPERLTPWGWHYRYTLMVDLAASAEEILARMNKTARQEIRKSIKDGEFTCTFIPSPTEAQMEAFADAYDAHPIHSDAPRLERERLRELFSAGNLQISECRDASGTILVWHGVLGHKRAGIAQPVYQISNYHQSADQASANTTGRANRVLYYQEFVYYKEQGYAHYDLNGWYTGSEDAKRLKINKFKEAFRGRLSHGFDCEEALTLRGWAYVTFRTLKRWFFMKGRADELRRLRKKPVLNLPEYLQ
ncbi:hypothetical protein [Mesoterricola silvestris]|uniref:Uncharacterized protein n=1 Tax=Mesoterricola silvestris TaxID=2927979 RepID=A0AA48GL40_9BACT|nr:hypothetical protein [Mesoterricola silvestris]BDU71774.1 hypothetical protein METEAL_09480 [Mesoterricola silvestris]